MSAHKSAKSAQYNALLNNTGDPDDPTSQDATITPGNGQELFASPEKRIRRYTANVYLDSSDKEAFYLIIAAGTIVFSVFEFDPATCTAKDKSASHMIMAAARGLLRSKGELTKLASIRLDTPEVTPGCKFHVDNFAPVFHSLFAAFNALMPRDPEAAV